VVRPLLLQLGAALLQLAAQARVLFLHLRQASQLAGDDRGAGRLSAALSGRVAAGHGRARARGAGWA
jgi:hypothetical protein